MARHGRAFPIKAHVTQVLGTQPSKPVYFQLQTIVDTTELNLARRRRTHTITPFVIQKLGPTPGVAPNKAVIIQSAVEFNANSIRRQRHVFPAHVLPGIATEFEPQPPKSKNPFDRRYSLFGTRAIIRQRQGIFKRG